MDIGDGSLDGTTVTPLTARPLLVELDDPTPTGRYEGWWLWRDFMADDFAAADLFSLDARPSLTVADDDPRAVNPENARQGSIGDCYFVAAVASIANTSAGRAHLHDMIESNDDGTYTVTWGDGVEVTVDSDIYVADDGSPAYGGSAGDEFNWFSVLEKSFAVRNDASYEEAVGGWAGHSWPMLLGDGETTRLASPSSDDLAAAIVDDLGAGRPAALAFDLNDVDGSAYEDGSLHEFSVLAVDDASGVVTIRNPWGGNTSIAKGLEEEFGATMDSDGRFDVPIDAIAPIVHTYESFEVDAP